MFSNVPGLVWTGPNPQADYVSDYHLESVLLHRKTKHDCVGTGRRTPGVLKVWEVKALLLVSSPCEPHS